MPRKAYIAVGSNIDPKKNIRAAFLLLKQQTKITGVSTFYQTEPLADPNKTSSPNSPHQSAYVNGVWEIETDLDPYTLKQNILRPIETSLGRRRNHEKFAPRTIDLDLIYLQNTHINEPGMRLPHPEIRERPFVAIPLLELAPDLILPDSGEKLADLPIIQNGTSMEPLEIFTQNMRKRMD